MQHPEEGLIHAWLDDQLPAAEATEIESHVATCRECAERVAEARGLIAGASRIAAHLDAVPANVIPAARRESSWLTRRSTMAIAATLLIGFIAYGTRNTAVPTVEEKATQTVVSAAPPVVAPVDRLDKQAATPPAPRTASTLGAVTGNQAKASVAEALPRASAATVRAPEPSIVASATITDSTSRTAERKSAAAEQRSALANVEVTGASSTGAGAGFAPTRASARMAAPAAAPPMAQADLRSEAPPPVVQRTCYSLDRSTDILPPAFALVMPARGQAGAVHYVDSTGALLGEIGGTAWHRDGDRVVITGARGVILTMTVRGSEVTADSPVGARTGAVTACR